MKKIVLFACSMFALGSYAQTILSVKIPTDTSNPPDKAAPVTVCPKLIGSTITFLLDENDVTLGIVKDSTGDALQSFTMTQPNKALFYDKLTNALTAICGDAETDSTILASFKSEPELYIQYLEKIRNLINADGKAGTLFISKKIHLEGTAFDSTRNLTPVNIKSITKAKKEARKFLALAENLRSKLDSVENQVRQSSISPKSQANNATKVKIQEIVYAVHANVDRAIAYLDSITSKIPDEKILYYYNKAIELSRKAMNSAQRALESVKGTNWQIKSSTTALWRNNFEQTPLSSRIKDGISYAMMDLSNEGQLIGFSAAHAPLPEENLGSLNSIESDTNKTGDLSFSPTPNFTIQSIQIQFQDGFIENIKIFGKLSGYVDLLRFENEFPIAFSTKKDFRNLTDICLFEKSDYRVHQNLKLPLGKVISYSENLANDNKDYSPANQVLTIKALVDSIKEVTLYKEQTSKILEVQVFSDLKGADNNNPNGLIQVELNKRLNFLSRRRALGHLGSWGGFNYVTPQFSIDKIEDNQKRLILGRIDTLTLASDTSKPISYASTINLLRHQIYSVGFDLTWLTVDIPVLKSTFYWGTGFHFGRSALQDTLRTRILSGDPTKIRFQAAPENNVLQFGVNTFQWGPYMSWQIFPDSRFGIVATQRFTWFKALSSNFVQVRDSAHYLKFIAQTPASQLRSTPYQFSRCLSSSEIFAYFKPNSSGDNKLFFRYRLNWDLANARENFHQLQVGFAMYLTATKEYDKLKKASNIE